ncbi:MAG: hypothetical protein VB858_09225 [Planctomycetaceae bacterium]|jgi:hypothetical protein
MTRVIATLTLALLTTVRSAEVSAAQASQSPNPALSQANALPQIALTVQVSSEGGGMDLYAPDADASDTTVSAIAIPNLIEAIIVIVDTEGPNTACDVLVEAGVPELMAQDMVLEALAIYRVERYLAVIQTAEGALGGISGSIVR